MLADQLTYTSALAEALRIEQVILDRIVAEVDPERFELVTSSTLEGLAKRELNLSVIVGKSAEAKERRLVPEVIEDFFLQAGPAAGVYPKDTGKDRHNYGLGRVPRTLWPIGERLERFNRALRKRCRIAGGYHSDDGILAIVAQTADAAFQPRPAAERVCYIIPST